MQLKKADAMIAAVIYNCIQLYNYVIGLTRFNYFTCGIR